MNLLMTLDTISLSWRIKKSECNFSDTPAIKKAEKITFTTFVKSFKEKEKIITKVGPRESLMTFFCNAVLYQGKRKVYEERKKLTEPNILVNTVLWQSSVCYPLLTQFLFKNLLSILGLCDSGRVDFRPSSSLAFPNSRCHRSRSDHPRTSWTIWWETDLGMAYDPKPSCERHQDPILCFCVCKHGKWTHTSPIPGDWLKGPWNFVGLPSWDWKWSQYSRIHSGEMRRNRVIKATFNPYIRPFQKLVIPVRFLLKWIYAFLLLP